jgi:NAD(P)-dependent dehydrogenase (short-subunit alcohol dehydrogenase family)
MIRIPSRHRCFRQHGNGNRVHGGAAGSRAVALRLGNRFINEVQSMRVIVTGAAQGIGEGVARMLAADGHTLVLADIQEDKVAAVAAELGAQPVRVDIADPASCLAMVAAAQQHLSGLDAVVQVAGLDLPPGPFDDTGEELWRKVIDVNLSGPWWVAKAAVPAFEASGAGRLVIISSVAAMKPYANSTPAYNAAKAGLHGLVMALASELEGRGILVNAIAPGSTGTGTPMSEEQVREHDVAFPLGIGGPEPIARMVSHLLGPGGDWISGSILNVSGGEWKGR